jgi:hypothetical protein
MASIPDKIPTANEAHLVFKYGNPETLLPNLNLSNETLFADF